MTRIPGTAAASAAASQPPSRRDAAVARALLLRAVPLLSSLAPDDLLLLAYAATEAELRCGDVIDLTSSPRLVVVTTAMVVAQKGGERRLEAGSVLGEATLLGSTATAALTVVERGRVVVLEKRGFDEALAANATLALGIALTLAGRLRTLGSSRHDRG